MLLDGILPICYYIIMRIEDAGQPDRISTHRKRWGIRHQIVYWMIRSRMVKRISGVTNGKTEELDAVWYC
jgi:hypothetical protein